MIKKLRRAILRHLVPEFFWPKTVEIGKTNIPVRGQPFSFGVKYLLVKGKYESHEIELIRGKIRHDDLIIEMGASIGVVTACAASNLGTSGQIVAIEADPVIVAHAQRWLANQGKNIEVIQGYGFPVFSFEKRPVIEGFASGGVSLGGRVQFNMDESRDPTLGESDNVFDVKSASAKLKGEVSVLIIDIEGSETILLKQNAGFTDSIRLILIELHPNIYGLENMNKIISVIIQEGFSQTATRGNSFLFERLSDTS